MVRVCKTHRPSRHWQNENRALLFSWSLARYLYPQIELKSMACCLRNLRARPGFGFVLLFNTSALVMLDFAITINPLARGSTSPVFMSPSGCFRTRWYYSPWVIRVKNSVTCRLLRDSRATCNSTNTGFSVYCKYLRYSFAGPFLPNLNSSFSHASLTALAR